MCKNKKVSWGKIFLTLSSLSFLVSVVCLHIFNNYIVSLISFASLFFMCHFAFICTKAEYYITGNTKDVNGKDVVNYTGRLYLLFAVLYILIGNLAIKSHMLSQLGLLEKGYEWLCNLFIIFFICILALATSRMYKK